ncbi:ArnT family glycosyltransferase [Planctomicrobium sp. SH661]|uniref:ArnT family glycosyltransferase n=1 Tax=Planctomicrobium sp. SH661 TaxID=3448124 RepID=UPI003F5B880E
MSSFRPTSIALGFLLAAAFTLRAWSPGNMGIEHFDEGVYASNLFSDHLDFKYPDRQFYAPPLWPAILEWVLILSGANPHAVMWVNVVLGTALVAAVFWTTKELVRVERPEQRVQSIENRRAGDVSLPMNLLNQFSETAGLAAAAIVAFSDMFIQYSRAALTDTPVCLWMTLAVGAGARAYRTASWGWVLAGGLLTGLAWWTKYNGWLPLAILGSGLAGWLLLTREGRASLKFSSPRPGPTAGRKKKVKATSPRSLPVGIRQSLQYGGIVAVAVICWLPYLSELQPTGGYAAVAANHRGYLVGWSGWGSSLLRHLEVDRYYSRGATLFGVVLATQIAWWLSPRAGQLAPRPTRKSGRGSPLLTLAISLPAVLVIAGAGLIPALLAGGLLIPLCCYSRKCPGQRWPVLPLGGWLLLAWIIGLGLTTPLYRPYPRLILPWLISLSMAAGIGLALAAAVLRELAADSENDSGDVAASAGRPTSKRKLVDVLVAVLLPLGVAAWILSPKGVQWEDRNGLRIAADEIVAGIQSDLQGRAPSKVPEMDCVIYVLAEPGLYYHLAALENEKLKFITQPASDLGMLTSGKIDPRVPAYLVTGPHSKDEAAQLQASKDRANQVHYGSIENGATGYSYHPSDLVLLDDKSPAECGRVRYADHLFSGGADHIQLPESEPIGLWSVRQ